MPRPSRRLPTLLALALLAGALAGCNRTVTHTVHGGAVDVTIDDYGLTPTRIVLPRAGRVTMRVHNAGVLAHNLAIQRDSLVIGQSATIGQGGVASISINLPRRSYRLLSSLSDDDVLGITGQLVVR